MKNIFNSLRRFMVGLSLMLLIALLNIISTTAQENPKEEDFFEIKPVLSPQEALLEIGGLTMTPEGNLALSTRRGDIYIVENPTSARPYFRKFASGLHEVLGLAYLDGAFFCAQRGELTKITDTDKDGKGDVFETIYAWPLSGNYHEYSYGPHIAPDGSFFVTTNLGFFRGESWRGKSEVPWRGWTLKIFEDGRMEPWATGMRSPCGIGIIDGELFYTDNQGEYIPSGGLWHVEKGVFTGNPGGLNWASDSRSPVKVRLDDINSLVDDRRVQDAEGKWIRPKNIVDEKIITMADIKNEVPSFRLPAVWLPHGNQGVSTSEPIAIPENAFGPFGGQVLVADQGTSLIARVFLEKVNGEYQGASFPFRRGFSSGIVRMVWAEDGSLFVGETRRGWGSAGTANEGLERLVWNGQVPFEMKTVRATPDGFEIEFTKEADPKTAADPASYEVKSFTYKYHTVYGSPQVNKEQCDVLGVKLSEDGMKARIIVSNLRSTFIHTITLAGVREKKEGHPLLHGTANYTLNNIPEGKKLSLNDAGVTRRQVATVSTPPSTIAPKGSAVSSTVKQQAKPAVTSASSKASDFSEVKSLLEKYTCTACHTTKNKLIGPGYSEVAKRKYTNEKIMELIHSPIPENWPDYETAMPPMPQVVREDALKIAAWINLLKD